MFNLCNAVSLILLSVGMAGFAPVLAHGSYPSEHTCIHDSHAIQSITKLDLDRNAEVLRNSAHDHHRNFGAQGVGNIRFVTRTADLTTAGQYCASAGQTAPNFQGGSATCSSNDVLTASKYSILLNNILPAALQRLSQTVSVTQYSSPIVPTTGACSYFTMPSNDTTNGVSNADFVVYVAAGPTATGVLAWASTCQTDSTSGRPNVGRINFNPAYIAWGDPTNNEMQIATATHELTHALGFSGGFFSTGGRQTTGFKRGKTVTMLITPKVLAVARDFLNCSTLDGVELEDEGTSGSVGSHFERRIYKDELMTAAGGSVHSAMSLAVLEDLGVGYVIDYGPCGNMTFGANAGCAFQSELCNTTAGGRGYWWCFDSNVSNIYCTFDNNAYGSCQVFTSSSALPSYFQYFSDPTVGGPQFMDGCPYVYGGTVCNVATVGTDYTYIAGDTYATDSKCWTVSSGVAQVPYSISSTGTRRCFETSCSSAGKTQFMVNGSSKLTCNSDGAAVSLASVGYSGTAYCPNRTTFCSTPTTTTAAPVTTTTTAASGVTTTKAPTTVAGTTTASTTAAGSTTATSTTGTTTNAGTTTTSGAATTTAVGATTTPSATTVTPPPPSTTTTTTAAAATPTPGSSTCDTSYLLSTSSPSPSSVLSVASINAILTAHNNARRTVSPYAQVMPMLTWNQSLADFAQNYMNTCPGMVHSTSTMRSNVAGFSYIGENLAAGSSNATYGINGGAASTSLWVGEQQYWSYGQVCQSGQVCGHYTQVIWAATLQVGCGWAYCPNQPYLNYWSCNYGPGGNYVGQNEYVSTTTSPSVCQIQTGQTTTTSTPGTLGTTTIGTTAPGATTTAMVPTPPTTTVGPTVTSLPQTDTGSATSMQSTTSSGTTQNGTSIPVLTTTSSSAPQQLTTTAPPVSAPTVAPTRQLVNGVIRIAGTQFNTLLSNSTMRTELAAYVALDIARLLGIPVSCVVITSLSIGSLVVNYTVTTDALQTTTSSSVQQAASSATASSSWLVNTSALYAQVAPTETLSVASSTTTSASVTPAPVVGPTTSSPSGGSSSSSSSCGSACIGFYAAIAAAAVLVVGGGIFVLLGRPKRVIPAEDNTPPPTVPTARKPY